MSRRTTMKDIAEACEVSVMTVSRALKAKQGVKVELREKILKQAEHLGYRPDPALQSLVRHRQSTLASSPHTGEVLPFLAPEHLKPAYKQQKGFFYEWVEGARQLAHQLGYRIEIEWLPVEHGALNPLLRTYYHRGIRGIFLSSFLDYSNISASEWAPFSVVMLGSGAHRYSFHAIRNDFYQMAQCAVDALYTRGYRRIAYLQCHTDIHTQDRAWGGIHNRKRQIADLEISLFEHPYKLSKPPLGLEAWIQEFKPDVLVSIAYPWNHWKKSGQFILPAHIGKVQLNGSGQNAHDWISGVYSHLSYQGQLAMQTLNQLILNNETGIPEHRTIIRVDGHWQDGTTAQRISAS